MIHALKLRLQIADSSPCCPTATRALLIYYNSRKKQPSLFSLRSPKPYITTKYYTTKTFACVLHEIKTPHSPPVADSISPCIRLSYSHLIIRLRHCAYTFYSQFNQKKKKSQHAIKALCTTPHHQTQKPKR